VLKPSHLSGRTILLSAHRPEDEPRLRSRMRDWLRRDHSRVNREWFYAHVAPGLLAEPLLRDEAGELPADVKAHVIGGRVRYFQVDRGRFGRHTRNLYGPAWQTLDVRTTLPRHAPDAPPPDLRGLTALSEQLAEPFEFLRVDCYLLGEQMLVGELTSSPGAGFGHFFPSSFAESVVAQWVPRSTPPLRQTSTVLTASRNTGGRTAEVTRPLP
jgi:teichuronopeptide biosynthesis TupA-like protein